MATKEYDGIELLPSTSRWRARIRHAGKSHHLGIYETQEQAAQERDRVLYKLGREMQIGLSLEQRLAVDSETLDSMLRPRIQSSYGASKFHGVGKFRNKFTTIFQRKRVGFYHKEEDAARAYDKLAFESLGSKARLNFRHEGSEIPVQPQRSGSSGTRVLKTRPSAEARRAEEHQDSQHGFPKPKRVRTEDTESTDLADEWRTASRPGACLEDSLQSAASTSSEGSPSLSDQEVPEEGWPPLDMEGNIIWNQPMSPLNVPEDGLELSEDEDDKEFLFEEAMKDPAFRYFMERKMAGGSSEPNLHILPPKAYEKWLQSTQQVLLSLFRAGKDEFESSKTSGLPSGDKRGDRQQQEVLDRTTLQADLTQAVTFANNSDICNDASVTWGHALAKPSNSGQGCSSSESSQAKPGEAVDDDPEVAYVKFLLGGSEAHQRAYEEDNEQARKMFQELKSSSGHTSEDQKLILELEHSFYESREAMWEFEARKRAEMWKEVEVSAWRNGWSSAVCWDTPHPPAQTF